jgi:hypothetical protein
MKSLAPDLGPEDKVIMEKRLSTGGDKPVQPGRIRLAFAGQNPQESLQN